MRLYIIILLLLSSSVFAFEAENCKALTEKVCTDYSKKQVDGFNVTKCWKYEQREICEGKEQNYCKIFEDNRGCDEISGTCLEKEQLGICKIFSKRFACGDKLEAKEETKHVRTDYNILRDEKDLSNCSDREINKNCEVAKEICIEGASTRNINGKDVYKDCWKWEKKYICNTGSYIDECKELAADNNCHQISKECLHLNVKSKECDHYEIKYQCNEELKSNKECVASKYCIGDRCKTSPRSQHNDFAYSISYLSILASLKSNELEGCKCPNNKQNCNPNEIDTSSCKFFTGDKNRCRKYTGEFNCCSDKGFIRQLVKCDQGEKDLFTKKKSKLCHFVGSWKGKGVNFYKKKQSYCCFKSKLSKIIQVEGRKQLNIGWGSKKNPDCRPLTLAELRRIDFSKIDFSELFGDLEEQAKSKVKETADKMRDSIKSPSSSNMQQMVNKKIQNFYKNGGGK
ncbi:conjugal transfer mating pair stabilization protein TraN (plasmid) [Rickettsiales bacterium Ac37b]|nr:conjugal transfer mating pair stabilization protein TraN [Rickettsiales bacterium Ac37b]